MKKHQGISGKILSVTFMKFAFKYINSVFGIWKKNNVFYNCLISFSIKN